MVIDALGAFLITAFNILFWALTFTKKNLSSLAKSYFWWSFFITLWSFGYGVTLSGAFDYKTTLVWNKYCQAMAMLIGPFFFRFGCTLAGVFEKYKTFFYGYLFFGVVNAAGLFFTPLYVKGLWSFGNYPYQPLGGPLYIVFTLFFFWCTIHSFIVAALRYRHTAGREEKQIKMFLLGTGLAYSGGGTLFLQGFEIPFPTHGVYLILAYVIIIAYAIHRYKFMEIPVLVRKTVVFTGLISFAIGSVAGLSFLLQRSLNIKNETAQIISFVFVLLGIEPVRGILAAWTDRYLFQKMETAAIVLNRLSKQIITIFDIEKLGKTILNTLETSLKLESGAILIKDENENQYRVLDSFGSAIKILLFSKGHSLVQFFNNSKVILNLEDLSLRARVPDPILRLLEQFKAHICIPLFVAEDLIGLLFLGKKRSDQEYTRDELEYFPTVASQVAIAFSYTRAIDILKKSQAEFVQQAKMAAIGTLSSGISHELKNPLNNIKGIAEVTLLNEKEGFNNNFTAADYRKTLTDVLQSIVEDVERAAEIMTGLSKMVHKGTDADLAKEPVNLEEKVAEAVVLLLSELKHNNITFRKEFPPIFPKIIGDGARISEVLLNVINNARQAIGRDGMIRVWGEFSGQSVCLHVTDSGPGMSLEIQEKIFDPFFTTKKQGEGTGLGLHISREIIKRMGAKISVRSEPGKGTTFTLEFPVNQTDLKSQYHQQKGDA